MRKDLKLVEGFYGLGVAEQGQMVGEMVGVFFYLCGRTCLGALRNSLVVPVS